MRTIWPIVYILVIAAAFGLALAVEKETKEVDKPVKKVEVQQIEKSVKKAKQQIKTVYGINGRVVNQALDAKGWHRVSGQVTLSSGVDTVTLNTSLMDGKQDISFIGDSTFGGRAWSLNQGNTNTYRIIPIGGNRFIVKSSDGADTATLRFIVEGE